MVAAAILNFKYVLCSVNPWAEFHHILQIYCYIWPCLNSRNQTQNNRISVDDTEVLNCIEIYFIIKVRMWRYESQSIDI